MGGEDRLLQESSRSGLWVGHHSEVVQTVLLPLLSALSPLLVHLTVALVGVARPPLMTVSVLTKVKATPTASSPKACRLVMLSSSLVVFGYSRPSS
jgi:hypothetical protein